MEVDAHGAPKSFQLTTQLEDMSSEYTGLIGARVVFDTGSTNLWIASVLCKASPCDRDGSEKFYDPAKSARAHLQESDSDIDIVFGTGELKGPLHVDTYRVGPMAVERQPFAMIREMTGDVFSSFPFEGILGLAFPSLSFGGIEPFFERVIKAKLLKSNEFAFYLNTDSDQPSALLWGGVDQDLFDGSIAMFPSVKAHVSEDNKAKYVLVDSGTTYFTAPSEMFFSVMKHFPEAPCSEVEDYPPIQYVLRSAHNQTYTLEVGQDTYMAPGLRCGEVFMRHFFTVFSRGNGSLEQAKVGFAKAKVGAQPKLKQSEQASYLQAQASVMRRQKVPQRRQRASGLGHAWPHAVGLLELMDRRQQHDASGSVWNAVAWALQAAGRALPPVPATVSVDLRKEHEVVNFVRRRAQADHGAWQPTGPTEHVNGQGSLLPGDRIVEFGTYMGYSALLMAQQLRTLGQRASVLEPCEVAALLQAGKCLLVDLRDGDRNVGTIHGAINVPAIKRTNGSVTLPFFAQLQTNANQWAKYPLVVLFCQHSADRAPQHASWFKNHARQGQRVQLRVGSAWDWLASGQLGQMDVLLLDHRGTVYQEDLRSAEPALHRGARVLADNVLLPGAPLFLAQVADGYHVTIHEVSEFMQPELEERDGLGSCW
eukprot:g14741.t1